MSKKTDWEGIALNSESQSFRKKNPHLFGGVSATAFAAKLIPSLAQPKKGKRRKEMNKTESEFAAMLDARVKRGEIVSWAYEEITLRWPDGMMYTPDFVIVTCYPSYAVSDVIENGEAVDSMYHNDCPPLVTLAEIKGAHAWAKDVVKFRAARDKWGDRFKFEFWQRIDGIWQETR